MNSGGSYKHYVPGKDRRLLQDVERDSFFRNQQQRQQWEGHAAGSTQRGITPRMFGVQQINPLPPFEHFTGPYAHKPHLRQKFNEPFYKKQQQQYPVLPRLQNHSKMPTLTIPQHQYGQQYQYPLSQQKTIPEHQKSQQCQYPVMQQRYNGFDGSKNFSQAVLQDDGVIINPSFQQQNLRHGANPCAANPSQMFARQSQEYQPPYYHPSSMAGSIQGNMHHDRQSFQDATLQYNLANMGRTLLDQQNISSQIPMSNAWRFSNSQDDFLAPTSFQRSFQGAIPPRKHFFGDDNNKLVSDTTHKFAKHAEDKQRQRANYFETTSQRIGFGGKVMSKSLPTKTKTNKHRTMVRPEVIKYHDAIAEAEIELRRREKAASLVAGRLRFEHEQRAHARSFMASHKLRPVFGVGHGADAAARSNAMGSSNFKPI